MGTGHKMVKDKILNVAKVTPAVSRENRQSFVINNEILKFSAQCKKWHFYMHIYADM